jgi:hypothetical protein
LGLKGLVVVVVVVVVVLSPLNRTKYQTLIASSPAMPFTITSSTPPNISIHYLFPFSEECIIFVVISIPFL